MGKVEDQQAMRQANRAAQSDVARPVAARPLPGQDTCGHRAISGRTCTREAGHQASGTSSHRYS